MPSIDYRPRAWRRLLGLSCLACVILLWTTSSFLASWMFADDTYSKPFLVTWLNTSFFSLGLLPFFIRRYRKRAQQGYNIVGTDVGQENTISGSYGRDGSFETSRADVFPNTKTTDPGFSVHETFQLAIKFSAFWFLANWFNSASFSYTSVASSTILTSTSSIFTLIFGALLHVEPFSWRKLAGVLASLSGIALISYVDTRKRAEDDTNRGSFPYMTPTEIILGDVMALTSAMLYGLYATGLTKAVGNEDRVNMPLFFGFIGLISTFAFWPVAIILHFTGFETFSLPSDGHLWLILFLNAGISLVSDVCWAYAILLTSPLVVTVGLTLTIPLSLVGQMLVNSQYSSGLYWVGAVIVVLSFIFINYQTEKDLPQEQEEANG